MIINIELKQHIGSQCKSIVKKGDKIKKGELIAAPDGLGVNIHSSVTGEVIDIYDNKISIKADEIQPEEYIKIKDTDTYLEAIEEAGVVGAGGAGFPTHLKLKGDIANGYIIVNAAECEPVLGHNIKLIEDNPQILVSGLKYMLEITKAKEAMIAIKPKHRKALIALGKLIKNEPNINIKYLPEMYPAGDERVIIRELLGVELKPGSLPLEAKAIVSNVETIKRIVEAIEDRKPVITKDITVAGRINGCENEGKILMDVPIGTPVKHIVEECGGYIHPHGEIVLGGPFTGSHGEEDNTVTKTLGGIFVAMPFPKETRKLGIIECECGASEERLEEIASSMGAEVIAKEKCKRMVEVNGRYRCDLPGMCPGQAEKILKLKSQGAEGVLVGNCED